MLCLVIDTIILLIHHYWKLLGIATRFILLLTAQNSLIV